MARSPHYFVTTVYDGVAAGVGRAAPQLLTRGVKPVVQLGPPDAGLEGVGAAGPGLPP